MKTTLGDLLATGKPVIADGAMGSNLMAAGLMMGEAAELLNVTQPEIVQEVHRGYINAGSQIVLTNTFGGSRINLTRQDVGERTVELNAAGAQIARAAADAMPQPVVVAGSIGPCGDLMQPYGPLTPDKAAELFAEQAGGLAAGGVDVFWIETMSAVEEVLAAITGCKQAAPAIPIVTTMSFERKGRTMMGVTPEQALQAFKEQAVLALGANCGNGPDEVITVIEKMRAFDPEVILVAKANAGMPKMVGRQAIYDASPDDMADYARAVHAAGAQIIGACCGSTAVHIRAIADALSN
ncbi:MAG: homocysteine S-methyltransferase family protein [Anaerolineales bacterium]|nr:homocysteine S-methyltransferase family protein [Anaerolineales bacterium]